MEDRIDFLELYERMFRLLPSGNIQKLMELANDITGVPILAVDIMYNLLGIAPQAKTGDYYWDYLLEHKGYETDMVVGLYNEGIMQSVNEMEAPYVIDWGEVNRLYPKIQGIIKVNGIVEGYVTMQCTREQITPDRMKAMELIMHTCGLFFKSDSESSMDYTYQKLFIGELMNNRIKTRRQLKLWSNDMGYLPNPPYRIAAISTESTQEKNVLSYIRKSVLQFFPYQLAMIQHNILYILQYELGLKQDAEASERQFNHILSKFNAHCGLSNLFYDLLDTANFQIQAEDALKLGRRPGQKYRIYYYQDYYLPAILTPRIEQMPKSNYLSPVITIIIDYDARHSTDFLDTLKAYILHLGNTKKTAELLHIHRNTLLYRINKIEELTNSSLEDYETMMHLMISFYMMDKNNSPQD